MRARLHEISESLSRRARLGAPFAAALACAALALSGCWGASRYTVSTTPPGAKVYLDDEYVGQSPCELESRLGLWRVFHSPVVRVEMPGYETVEYTKIARTKGADPMSYVLACCGVGLLFPCGNACAISGSGRINGVRFTDVKENGRTYRKYDDGRKEPLFSWCNYQDDDVALIPLALD